MLKCAIAILFLFVVSFAGSALAAGDNPQGIADIWASSHPQLWAEKRDALTGESDKGFLPNFGNYFDIDNPGWGLDIQSLGDLIFAVWFTYNLDGTPTWYIIVGALEAKGGGMSITGNIDTFKWDSGGAPGNQATATTVGTMTIAWSGTSNADVSWTLDGVDGSAPVQFFRFGGGRALGNMTGHYFNFFAPGWGFTLLTQGAVTAMTMYWYKNGQPVWAQGVVTDLGTTPVILLQYFDGPGLCPACLPRKGGGATTTPLAQLQLNWGVALPPQARLERFQSPVKGGPLGVNPFDDIPLGFIAVTTEAITSAFEDNFDPTYSNIVKNKGPGCLAFEYDPGFFTDPPATTGTWLPAYMGFPPVGEGRLPVYTDSACTTPFMVEVFDVPQPSFVLAGSTGDDGGVAFTWSSFEPFSRQQKGFDDDEGDCDDGNCGGSDGGAGRRDDDDEGDRAAKGVLSGIRVYGSNRYDSQRIGTVVVRFPGESDPPPPLADILSNPDDDVYVFIPSQN